MGKEANKKIFGKQPPTYNDNLEKVWVVLIVTINWSLTINSLSTFYTIHIFKYIFNNLISYTLRKFTDYKI